MHDAPALHVDVGRKIELRLPIARREGCDLDGARTLSVSLRLFAFAATFTTDFSLKAARAIARLGRRGSNHT